MRIYLYHIQINKHSKHHQLYFYGKIRHNLDTLEVQVEVNEQSFSDKIKILQGLSTTIKKDIKDLLGVTCKVRLVEPKTITRSEGKAKRVIDNRQNES